MNIPIIFGTLPQLQYGLDKITKILCDTFEELTLKAIEINLCSENIPLYNGTNIEPVKTIMEKLNEAKAIVFISSSSIFSPCSITQSFLEYFMHPEYQSLLKDKYCFVIVVSNLGYEGCVMEYMSKTLNYFGAFSTTTLALNTNHTKNINSNEETKEILEKHIEDFYRIVKGNRKFIIPSDFTPQSLRQDDKNIPRNKLTNEEIETLFAAEPKNKITIEDLNKTLDNFNENQEQDINEITQFFADKLKTKQDIKPIRNVFSEPLTEQVIYSTPRSKTCKQLTQSLSHYFQPQIAADLNISMQINISGDETFEGYLKINNGICEFYEGKDVNPDLTILTNSNIWMDILKGKYTAQKAFMIGHLKVRGNFVFLTKFDQLFKI